MMTTSMRREILDRSDRLGTPRRSRRVQRAFFLTVDAVLNRRASAKLQSGVTMRKEEMDEDGMGPPAQ